MPVNEIIQQLAACIICITGYVDNPDDPELIKMKTLMEEFLSKINKD